MWTLYVDCFCLANTVRDHCLRFLCFQEIGALLSLAVCKSNRYCLCVVIPMLFIYVCCESLWKPERPHVHYYWPHSIKTKLFSESSLVMASGVYLGSHHWKWECWYKSCQPVAVHSVWLETVRRIWLFLWEKKLNTTELSQRCLTNVFDQYFLCLNRLPSALYC